MTTQETNTAAPHLNELRKHLMATLESLRDRTNPMEPDRARAVAQVASVLVDTAKIEIDYLKATGQDRASFLEQPAEVLPGITDTSESGYSGGTVQRLSNGVTRHRMGG